MLAAEDWDSSPFLKNTVKPLEEIKQSAEALVAQLSGDVNDTVASQTIESGGQPVYIALFQAQGHDLKKWAMQLRSIDRYMLGRPIYTAEADVCKMIHQKVNQSCEAYAKVAVKPSAIQEQSLLPKREDRNGCTLLTLMPGTVTSDHIIEFVHVGKTYAFVDGKLREK